MEISPKLGRDFTKPIHQNSIGFEYKNMLESFGWFITNQIQ